MAAAAGRGEVQPANRTRCQELLTNVPLVTLTLMALCIGCYCGQLLGDFYACLGAFAIQPLAVIFQLQLWRLVTAAFTHGNLLHIGMNMASLYQLGSGLVRARSPPPRQTDVPARRAALPLTRRSHYLAACSTPLSSPS